MSHAPSRRSGFTALPLRCLQCARKLPPSAMQLTLTPIRCERCGRVHLSISVLHAGVVFLVESDADEIALLSRRGANAYEVLTHLGLTLEKAG